MIELGPASSEGERLLHKIVSTGDLVQLEYFACDKINRHKSTEKITGNRQSTIYWKQTVAIFPMNERVNTTLT